MTAAQEGFPPTTGESPQINFRVPDEGIRLMLKRAALDRKVPVQLLLFQIVWSWLRQKGYAEPAAESRRRVG